MRNPQKFDRFDYTVQQGCPDSLKDAWFAINHNYRLVSCGETEKEACDWLESEEIAKAVLFLGFHATFTTGMELPVDWGWLQL